MTKLSQEEEELKQNAGKNSVIEEVSTSQAGASRTEAPPTIEIKKEKSDPRDRSPELKDKLEAKPAAVAASEDLSSKSLKPTPQQSEKSPITKTDASKDAGDKTQKSDPKRKNSSRDNSALRGSDDTSRKDRFNTDRSMSRASSKKKLRKKTSGKGLKKRSSHKLDKSQDKNVLPSKPGALNMNNINNQRRNTLVATSPISNPLSPSSPGSRQTGGIGGLV